MIERRARGDTTRATDLPVPIESILHKVESLSKLVVKRGKLNKMKRISRSFFALPLTRTTPYSGYREREGDVILLSRYFATSLISTSFESRTTSKSLSSFPYRYRPSKIFFLLPTELYPLLIPPKIKRE